MAEVPKEFWPLLDAMKRGDVLTVRRDSVLIKTREWLDLNDAIDRARFKMILNGVWNEGEDERTLKEPEPQNFPRWQPVKCPEESCGWQGPAAKATRWQGDQTFYCPKCGMKVIKHESQGSNPA